MAVKKFSSVDGAIAFDPTIDVFNVDDASYSAASFAISAPAPGSVRFIIDLIGGGTKTITLQDSRPGLNPPLLEGLVCGGDSANLQFADGSRLLIGDNTSASAEDDLANRLAGSVNNDQLIGLGGNDTLNGRAGADKLVGREGDDTYVVDDAADIVVEKPAEGRDLVRSSATYQLRANVDDLTLTGTAAIDGTGNGDGNVIAGNTENNALAGVAGNDQLVGKDGDDTLNGGAGSDTLEGRAGQDVLKGAGGADVLVYGGSDQIDGGTENDTLSVDVATLDLAGKAGEDLVSIEAIQLANASGSLTLTKDDVLRLSSTGTLLVKGDEADSLWFGTGWTHDGTAVDPMGETGTYTIWTQDGATLLVESGIGVALALSRLDGTNGFRLDGSGAEDRSGGSVASAGDFNGDGFDDVIVGAYRGDAGGFFAGETYVVFGGADGFDSVIDLGALDGTEGFRLVGRDISDDSGCSVASAGDVNGDGYGDLIVGAKLAGNGGESYVVFGSASGFSSSLNLGALNGLNGFRVNGIDGGDRSGYSVASAGDVNGDGFADLIIGAPSADHGVGFGAGEAYVVFGAGFGFASALNLSALDGANGFRLDGVDESDNAGASVSSAGDVNGDGFDDLIVGALGAPVYGGAGESYVVFGTASGFAATLNLSALDGTNGFRLDGIDGYDGSGCSVASAGDVNGDGFADLIVGARYADGGAGEAYVVFGKTSGFGSALDFAALDGANGFRLDGVDAFDNSGASVASAGDVNGDGYDDLIIGAPGGSRDGPFAAGESYVVFGAASGFGSAFDLSALDGAKGFRLIGVGTGGYGDYSGASVASAGDVNGDGYDDLIVGAYGADSYAGQTYIVYGGDFTGAAGHMGTSGNNTLIGAGGPEVFSAGAGDDRIRIEDLDFFRIDGGSGRDTLALKGTGLDFDFSLLDPNAIRGIERIDLLGGGNTLTLGPRDLVNLSDSSNRLTVFGTASDTVDLSGDAWSFDHTDAVGFDYYVLDEATLRIDAEVTVIGVT